MVHSIPSSLLVGVGNPQQTGLEPLRIDGERKAMIQNTQGIQDALLQVGAQGGGRVEIPPGIYWIRSLMIPSNTELHVSAGAVLKAWPYPEDYLDIKNSKVVDQHPQEKVDYLGLTLIYSSKTDRASLTGSGTIDGNGFAFWDIPIRDHVRNGGTKEELGLAPNWEDDSPFYREKPLRISPMVEFDHCTNVVVAGITLAQSAGWTLHPYCCDRVTIRDLTIDNHLYGPNTDGIDINGCNDVIITGCRLTCGDDAIIIKATKDARACQRITVSDCIIATHCAAFGIGAEVCHPIRDITVTNLVIERALRIIQIELWDPGLVENIVISNIAGANMTDIPLERPIYLDIQHHGRTDGNLGAIRNVMIRGLSAVTRGRCLFTAADGSEIRNLILSDLQFIIPEIEDPQISVVTARSNQMSNSSPETRAERALFIFDNVHGLSVSNIQVQWPLEVAKDPARTLRDSYDRGALLQDKRKQQSLVESKAPLFMDAILVRNTSNGYFNIPQLQPFGPKGQLVRKMGTSQNIKFLSYQAE